MRSFVCVTLLLSLALAASAQSINRQYTLTWGGAFTPCTNCGGADGAFACSNAIGKWNDGIGRLKFAGDVPKGYVMTGVTATLSGTYNCLNLGTKSIVGVSIAGIPVDVQRLDGSNQCKCGTCDGNRVYTNDFFRTGWPGIDYFAGSNVLQVTVGDENPICLSTVTVNATFTKTSRKNFILDLQANTSSPFANCGSTGKICGSDKFWVSSSTYFAVQSINIPFVDPVGSAGRVIAVDVMAIGQWGENSGYPPTFSVQNQLIGKGSPALYDRQCTGCGGAAFAFTPQPFQFGWPNYVAGGTNSLNIQTNHGGNTAYPFAVSRVLLSFTYI